MTNVPISRCKPIVINISSNTLSVFYFEFSCLYFPHDISNDTSDVFSETKITVKGNYLSFLSVCVCVCVCIYIYIEIYICLYNT